MSYLANDAMTAGVREVEIQDDEVKRGCGLGLDRVRAVDRKAFSVTARCENRLQELPHLRVGRNEKDARFVRLRVRR